ncbi:hypothetical protein [Sphingobacterium sp. SYP-B4668]|uniref:hypothetical protein n=1 Tax=Sphingobacterium sp. SYP-B4668 TaxID=2996035 RepID=UPI0022DE09F0|nr:hypothetical protein [Sphingobacterium sp. SYP-B4668]
MKIIALALHFFIALLYTNTLYAQQNTDDSTSYESQRKRVNDLLHARSTKFGEYDVSLQKKTGIFGLFKSKGDMQRSIDILKQIVITDNNIFIETKKLLDFKDFEREKFQKLATEYDGQITAYMTTINKLQNENEELKEQLSALEGKDHGNDLLLYLTFAGIIVLGFFTYKFYKQRSVKN